ncbi:MAG: 4-hydroxy-tetrahydrodipicolinate reductase [Acidimicrobiales bacterium]|nr:4-hydroxy-tetrahydrodipicolinate reductase [Acidimicrobiales bacterium]
MRVGVCGAGGRMGATVCGAVCADPELELVAAVDPAATGQAVAGADIEMAPTLDAFGEARAEVVVDFTVVDAARENLAFYADHGMHAVVGTTGFSDADLASFADAFAQSNCVIAPNFAISAVLMMRFAELAAPFFDSAEVIELHHENKIDAPSGTAMRTVERMAAASSTWTPDPTERLVLDGARGATGPGGIHVHSVRLKGLVAHQEVILGAEGQSLVIRQDSYDRSSFMPGVVLAVKRIAEHPGLTIGLEPFLGL